MKLNKIFGFLPVTRWELNKVVKYLEDILDGLETIDKQHSNIEQDILEQLAKNTATQQQPVKQDNKNHVEFG
jgi:hypothetical protein